MPDVVTTHSVWLEVPSLQRVVSELAAEAGNPSYVPHLTVAGGIDGDPNSTATALSAAAPVLPLGLSFARFGTQHEETRWFCLVADQTPSLARLFEAAAAVAGADAVQRFAGWPHVSLVYGTAAARVVWPDPLAPAERLGDTLFGDHPAAALTIWRTSGDVATWQRLHTVATA